MAKALEEAGFDVTIATDANQAAMEKAVHAFGAKLKQSGGVGLFYFSGHGAQIAGENYLIPVSLTSADEIEKGSVKRDRDRPPPWQARTRASISSFSMLAAPIRSTPTARMDFRASIQTPACSSIPPRLPVRSLWTARGTTALTPNISPNGSPRPTSSIEDTFKRTLKGVYVDTHGQQTPWISSTFFGDFVFRPEGAEAEAEDDTAGEGEGEDAEEEPAEAPTLTGVYRASGTNPSGSEYTGIVALEEDGDDFKLTWWIGKDEFHGSGHYAGKMLVINWAARRRSFIVSATRARSTANGPTAPRARR